MFKVLVLETLYNLADEQVDYQIHDRRRSCTDASVLDSKKLDEILDKSDASNDVWANSSYRSAETEAKLREKGYKSRIHRSGATTLISAAEGRQHHGDRGCVLGSNTCLRIRKAGSVAYSCVPMGWRVRP
jgi:hypothetical protein